MTYRLEALAEVAGGRVCGDPERRIDSIKTLESAGPRDLSFVTSPRYHRLAATTRAGALLASEKIDHLQRDYLLCENPHASLVRLFELFFPRPDFPAGIHPTAVVAEDALVDSRAYVGPHAVVGSGSRVGAQAEVHALVSIGRHCTVGRGAILYPHVVLYDHTEVGERSVIHGGAVLGADGFGYSREGDEWRKLPHVGGLVVEADVEVGANSTIDRGTLDPTRIGAGTKIDNLVQVGHNVTTGRSCLFCGQAGIAGSTRLGNGVILAGQAGVIGHLTLGDGVQVTAKSAVFRSVEKGRTVSGTPALDNRRWKRQVALVNRIQELQQRVTRLERSLAAALSEPDSEAPDEGG